MVYNIVQYVFHSTCYIFDSRSPILVVVEITYDFGLRIETGTERRLLLYIIY